MKPTYEEVVALWHELRPKGWEGWPMVPDVHWFPDYPGLVRIWDFDNPEEDLYDDNTVYLDVRERCIVDINGDNEEFGVDAPWADDCRILRPVDPDALRLVEEAEAANASFYDSDEFQRALAQAREEVKSWGVQAKLLH